MSSQNSSPADMSLRISSKDIVGIEWSASATRLACRQFRVIVIQASLERYADVTLLIVIPDKFYAFRPAGDKPSDPLLITASF
jgi:hypothetical protein